MTLDPTYVRARFPSLRPEVVFLDNPGGTQIVDRALERMQDYLLHANANRGGAYPTSRATDETVEAARAALADFLNAARPEEIIFGPNMTTLTFHLSRALVPEFRPEDEIVVTRLDHDANIAPWLALARARGCRVRWVDFDVETGTLDLKGFEAALSSRTRLVAVGYASNALGTINPVHRLVRLAHEAGALCFVDAVQYAPHGPIDVQRLGCDFLALSIYKVFGPHVGALYGRYEHLERLQPDKVRPAPEAPPGKFETGTQNHEGIAGALGALEYLEALGERFGQEHLEGLAGTYQGRRLRLKQAMTVIRAYEMELSRALLERLCQIPGLRLYGPTDPRRLDHRVPTFAFTMEGHSPRAVAERLAARGIYVWDGNFYALAVTERLGLEGKGGLVRVGAVHYNTVAEIERLGQALQETVADGQR